MQTILDSSSPIFGLYRDSVPEVVVHGNTYLKRFNEDPRGGDANCIIVMRSLLKPWQFAACEIEEDDNLWALGLSSHSCQPQHLQFLEDLTQKTGMSEEDIICPRTFPMDQNVSAKMRLGGEKRRRLYHPCSGKHLAMLASCIAHGESTDRYWEMDHPMQERIHSLVGQVVGEKPIWLNDSCGLPTMAVSAGAMLNMWERLATSQEDRWTHIKKLWIANPFMVGGSGRLDSDLISAGEGNLIAKEGADGMLIVQTLGEDGTPPTGIFIKIASGYNQTHLALALWATLAKYPDLGRTYDAVRSYLHKRLEKWVPQDQKLVLSPFKVK